MMKRKRVEVCGHPRVLELRSDPTLIICICRACAHRWVSVPLNP